MPTLLERKKYLRSVGFSFDDQLTTSRSMKYGARTGTGKYFVSYEGKQLSPNALGLKHALALAEKYLASIGRKNPRGRHLAGASAKEQRQYEHILRSELDRGASLQAAKRIAAATVNARRGDKRNPYYTVEAIPKYTKTVKDDIKAFSRGSAIRQLKKQVEGPKNIYRYRVEKNPSKYYDLIIKGQAVYTPQGWK